MMTAALDLELVRIERIRHAAIFLAGFTFDNDVGSVTRHPEFTDTQPCALARFGLFVDKLNPGEIR